MWILVISFLAYGDPLSAHFVVHTHSIEFQSEATCEAARKRFLDEVNQSVDELKEAIAGEKEAGTLKGPNDVRILAICTAK